MVKKGKHGGRKEYRAIVTRAIEPKELGLAGAVQIARVDRRIGAKGKLCQTWLVTSRFKTQRMRNNGCCWSNNAGASRIVPTTLWM